MIKREWMKSRDFEAGIKYLKESFSEPWNLIIEKACRENLRHDPQPKRSKFLAYANQHKYGPNEIMICEGNFKQLVFETMLKNGKCTAPSLSDMPIYTGMIDTLRPFKDKIVKLVNDKELEVYNVTLPEHVLFPGFVKLNVYEKVGKTFVGVLGEGIGNWGRVNTFFGPLIFKRILNRDLVPIVQENIKAT